MSASSAHEGKCRGCGARMLWTVTEKGRRMPVDLVPSEDGNLRLTDRLSGQAPLSVTVSKAEREGARVQAEIRGEDPPRFYVSHFATCPERGRFKR